MRSLRRPPRRRTRDRCPHETGLRPRPSVRSPGPCGRVPPCDPPGSGGGRGRTDPPRRAADRGTRGASRLRGRRDPGRGPSRHPPKRGGGGSARRSGRRPRAPSSGPPRSRRGLLFRHWPGTIQRDEPPTFTQYATPACRTVVSARATVFPGATGEKPKTALAPVSNFRFATVYVVRKLGFPTKFHPMHRVNVVVTGTRPATANVPAAPRSRMTPMRWDAIWNGFWPAGRAEDQDDHAFEHPSYVHAPRTFRVWRTAPKDSSAWTSGTET